MLLNISFSITVIWIESQLQPSPLSSAVVIQEVTQYIGIYFLFISQIVACLLVLNNYLCKVTCLCTHTHTHKEKNTCTYTHTDLPHAGSHTKHLQQPGLSQAKARSQGTSFGSPTKWQEFKHFPHHPLPPRYIIRKLYRKCTVVETPTRSLNRRWAAQVAAQLMCHNTHIPDKFWKVN